MIEPGAWNDAQRVACAVLAALCLALAPVAALATPQRLVLDSARSRIHFSVDAAVHSVEGSIAVASGDIRFDVESGTASGGVVLAISERGTLTRPSSRPRCVGDWAKTT